MLNWKWIILQDAAMQLWGNSPWQHLAMNTGQFSIQGTKNWCWLLNLYQSCGRAVWAETPLQVHHSKQNLAINPWQSETWSTRKVTYQSQQNKTHRGALGTHPPSSGHVQASFAASPQPAHLQLPGALTHSYLASLLRFLSAIHSVPWCLDELLCAGVDDSSPGEFRERLEQPKFKACYFLTFLLIQLCSRNERFTVGVKQPRMLLFITCCKHCPCPMLGGHAWRGAWPFCGVLNPIFLIPAGTCINPNSSVTPDMISPMCCLASGNHFCGRNNRMGLSPFSISIIQKLKKTILLLYRSNKLDFSTLRSLY